MSAPYRPVQGDAFDRLIREQQATQEAYQAEGNRKAAALEAATRFPGMSPQELVPIAKNLESELNRLSSPEFAAEQKVLKEQRGIEEAGEAIGSAAVFGGGILGTALGGQPGAVAGSGLGGLVQSGTRAALGTRDVTVGSALRNMRNQSTYEMLGFEFVDKTLGSVARFFRGNKPVSDEIVESFAAVGMRPSLQEVSDNFWSESARTVLGSLPFANKPFKKRAQQATKEFGSKLDEFVEAASPDWAIAQRMMKTHGREATAEFVEQLNRGAFDNLSAGFKVLRDERDARFLVLKKTATQLEARAADSGVSLSSPTTSSRAAIGQIADRFSDGAVVRLDGTVVPMTAELEQTAEFVRDIGTNVVPRNMTFTELTALKKRVSDQIETVKDNPTAAQMLKLMKQGVEEDMVRAAGVHPQLKRAYDDAMSISEEFLTLLQDISTRRIQRVHSQYGRQELQEVVTGTGEVVAKNAGTMDISQTVDILAKSASPNEIRQFYGALRRGVGEPEARRTMQLALGKKVREAVESTLKEVPERGADSSYAPKTFLRALGIESPDQKSFGPMMAMFEASGIPAQQAVHLSKVLDALYSVKNARVSQLLARQTNLGGFKTILRSLSAGAIGGTAATSAGAVGLPHAAALFLLSRSYGKWMTVPWRARAVSAMADARLPEHARTQAAISVFTDKELWSSEDPAESEKYEAIRESVWYDLQTKKGQRAFLRSLDDQLGVVGQPKK